MASSRIFLATAGLFADEELLSSRGSPSPGPTPVLGSELNVRGLQPDRFTVPYKPVISDPAATWKAEREREAQASLPPLFAKGAPPAARLTDPSVPSLLPTPRLSARGDAPASENAGYHAHNHRDAPYAPSLAGASWRHGSTSNSPPGGASNSVPASAPGRAQALESWRHGAAPGSAAGRELVGESWRHGSAGGSVQSSRPASPARSYCGSYGTHGEQGRLAPLGRRDSGSSASHHGGGAYEGRGGHDGRTGGYEGRGGHEGRGGGYEGRGARGDSASNASQYGGGYEARGGHEGRGGYGDRGGGYEGRGGHDGRGGYESGGYPAGHAHGPAHSDRGGGVSIAMGQRSRLVMEMLRDGFELMAEHMNATVLTNLDTLGARVSSLESTAARARFPTAAPSQRPHPAIYSDASADAPWRPVADAHTHPDVTPHAHTQPDTPAHIHTQSDAPVQNADVQSDAPVQNTDVRSDMPEALQNAYRLLERGRAADSEAAPHVQPLGTETTAQPPTNEAAPTTSAPTAVAPATGSVPTNKSAPANESAPANKNAPEAPTGDVTHGEAVSGAPKAVSFENGCKNAVEMAPRTRVGGGGGVATADWDTTDGGADMTDPGAGQLLGTLEKPGGRSPPKVGELKPPPLKKRQQKEGGTPRRKARQPSQVLRKMYDVSVPPQGVSYKKVVFRNPLQRDADFIVSLNRNASNSNGSTTNGSNKPTDESENGSNKPADESDNGSKGSSTAPPTASCPFAIELQSSRLRIPIGSSEPLGIKFTWKGDADTETFAAFQASVTIREAREDGENGHVVQCLQFQVKPPP